MNITFGIRLRGDIGYNRFWLSFASMEKPHAYNIIAKTGYNPGESARQIFREFLRAGSDYLLMLDDDAEVAPQTLNRLLSRNLPIVGALTWTKTLPPTPTIWRGVSGITPDGKYVTWRTRVDDAIAWLERTEVGTEIRKQPDKSALVLEYNPPDALVRTDNVGFHCLLIQRGALERIGEPFCQESQQGVHEDFDFSARAICAGIDLYVDRTVLCGHINARAIGALDFWAWMNALRLDEEEFASMEARADRKEGK